VHARSLSILLAALCVAPAAAAAEPIPSGGIADVAGPRTLALSAAVGVAAGNDGIYVNPGALAARKRYSAETGLYVDRRGAANGARLFGGSIVDSQSSPVTAAVSYLRADEGEYTGNLWHLALAGPVLDKVFLGVAGKYLSVKGPDRTSAATVDAGLLLQATQYLSVGVAGWNLVSIANDAVAPMGAGAGLALGDDRIAQVTADWRVDLDRRGETTNRYAVGAEVLLARLIPVRAGFMRDETLDTRWWSLGAGLVTRQAAIDVGYRQSTEDPSARSVAASLKLFLQP
jgi:hypothetical protein